LVPYTEATQDVNLGAYTLAAADVFIRPPDNIAGTYGTVIFTNAAGTSKVGFRYEPATDVFTVFVGNFSVAALVIGATGNSIHAGNLRVGGPTAPTVPLDVTGDVLSSGVVTATTFKISTVPTANSTGTVTIVAKDVSLLTANTGWLPLKRSDGTIVYVPYWT
jgi:hypothetical protein